MFKLILIFLLFCLLSILSFSVYWYWYYCKSKTEDKQMSRKDMQRDIERLLEWQKEYQQWP